MKTMLFLSMVSGLTIAASVDVAAVLRFYCEAAGASIGALAAGTPIAVMLIGCGAIHLFVREARVHAHQRHPGRPFL